MKKKRAFSKRKVLRKKKKRLKSFFYFFSGLVFLFFLIWLLVFSDFFQVKEIRVFLTQKDKNLENKIINCADSLIPKKILFWQTRSIFLISSQGIKKNILDNFCYLEDLEIQKKYPKTLILKGKIRKKDFVFCDNFNNCFFADNFGILFERKGTVSFPVLTLPLEKEKSFSLCQQLPIVDYLPKLLKIKNQIEEGLKIPLFEIKYFFPEKVVFVTKEGWQIYFNLDKEIDWQLTKLDTVLKERLKDFESRKNLWYIDVRFGNFANLKYNEEKLENKK